MGALECVLSQLDTHKQVGNGYTARCPAHDDKEASLSISEGTDGRVLMKCFAGCSAEKVVDALGLKMSDLFPKRGRGDVSTRKSRATVQHPSKTVDTQGNKCCNPENNGVQQCNGFTLAGYAEAKKLPVDFLRGLGLSDMAYMGAPAVRIPYHNPDGTEGPVRFRVALGKSEDVDGRFKWKKGSKPCLYGLERKHADILILCEGESDCHTLWHHGFPALGTPGASNWKEDRDALHFDGCSTIYAIKEPDDGGEALIESLRKVSSQGPGEGCLPEWT